MSASTNVASHSSPDNHGDSALTAYAWQPQPHAEALIQRVVARFLQNLPAAARLANQMREQTGTRFADWIDTITLSDDPALAAELTQAGFRRSSVGAEALFVHEGGIFPRVLLRTAGQQTEIALKVESIADFAAVHEIPMSSSANHSQPLSLVRKLLVHRQPDHALYVIERHGCPDQSPPPQSAEHRLAMVQWLEILRTRPRRFDHDEDGFAHLHDLLSHAIVNVGQDVACDLFFFAEREYWQRRNDAAQVQKARQDQLGLGWANHDHHTYRSSREHFTKLIALFELLGLRCRERFYAGAHAGWGAQVMEQPRAGIVVFADVDLAPDELFNDFAHQPLPARHELGTVGLWCALHGQAILEAGMHHLECQFDFESLRDQLEKQHGVHTMKPFTDLPYLRQAFTQGQRWPVREARLAALLNRGQITPEQADKFRQQGAIGSHLENLQRDAGYKGFNQQGVSEIIAGTDPRLHLQA